MTKTAQHTEFIDRHVTLASSSILKVLDDLQAGMTLEDSTFTLEMTSLDLSVKEVSAAERAAGISFTSRPPSEHVSNSALSPSFPFSLKLHNSRQSETSYRYNGYLLTNSAVQLVVIIWQINYQWGTLGVSPSTSPAAHCHSLDSNPQPYKILF